MRTAFALYLVAVAGALHAQQGPVRIDSLDIGGVVTGANGPEAGVWVIAATNGIPTRFAKIVVTNRHGSKAGALQEGLETATGELGGGDRPDVFWKFVGVTVRDEVTIRSVVAREQKIHRQNTSQPFAGNQTDGGSRTSVLSKDRCGDAALSAFGRRVSNVVTP